MSARMQPIEKDGMLRPDLDFRDVPAGVMAAYLGISVSALWNRTRQGVYAGGTRKIGRMTYYRPRVIVASPAVGSPT